MQKFLLSINNNADLSLCCIATAIFQPLIQIYISGQCNGNRWLKRFSRWEESIIAWNPILKGPIKRMNNFFRGGTKFSEKLVPGTKIFSKNFVPPEQIFPEQNSSDSPLLVWRGRLAPSVMRLIPIPFPPRNLQLWRVISLISRLLHKRQKWRLYRMV